MKDFIKNLNDLEFNNGIMSHHDAISGTSKERIAYEF